MREYNEMVNAHSIADMAYRGFEQLSVSYLKKAFCDIAYALDVVKHVNEEDDSER